MQHFWSLSVEEQFYLVWPLLILAAAVSGAPPRESAPHRRLWWAVVAHGRFSAAPVDDRHQPVGAYFVTPTRVWEFGAGGLLGLLLAGRASATVFPQRWSALACARLVGRVCSNRVVRLHVRRADSLSPGLRRSFPSRPRPRHRGRRATGRLSPTPLLRWRPVRFFGDISYSLYLWHWPPIVILPIVLGHHLGFSNRSLVLLGAIAAAAATKRWVEDPVRFTRRPTLRRPLTALVATTAGAAVIVSGAWVARGTAVAEERDQQAVAQAALEDAVDCFGAAAMDPQQPCSNSELDGVMIPAPAAARRDWPTYKGCSPGITGTAFVGCTFGNVDDPDVPHIVLIGDSHAQVLLTALEPLAEQGKVSVTARIKGPARGPGTRSTPPTGSGSTPARSGRASSSGGSSSSPRRST